MSVLSESENKNLTLYSLKEAVDSKFVFEMTTFPDSRSLTSLDFLLDLFHICDAAHVPRVIKETTGGKEAGGVRHLVSPRKRSLRSG